MFQFQESISPREVVEKRLASKQKDSPAEQTESQEVVNVSEDAPAEEVEEVEAAAEADPINNAEESEEEEVNPVADADTEEDLYVEYKGREINLREVEEWERGNLRQSDYTRKTQELSDNRKALEEQQNEFNATKTNFDDKVAQLDAIIKEGTPSAETLAEWREYEPEKYIDHTEKMSRRKKLLDDAKAELTPRSVDMAKVSAELFEAHPEWMDNGKQSKKFLEDTELMSDYAKGRGIGEKELATFEAKHYEVMLDAARFNSINKSNAAIEKKVRKAPVSTRPKAQTKSHITTDIAALEKRVREKGREEDFVKLRQLKRQLNK